MLLKNVKNKWRLQIAGGCVLILLCVLGAGIITFRHFYPAIFISLSQMIGPMAGQIKEQHTTGVTLGLEVHSGKTSKAQQTTYFSFHPEETWIEVEATLRILSDTEHPAVYALTGLVDYVQVPLTVTQISYPVYPIEAEPSEPITLNFSFVIPNQPGRHQLFLTLFREIDMREKEAYFRDFQAVIISDIVIGEDALPELVYQEAPYIEPDDPHYDIQGVHINQDLQGYRQPWISATVMSGEIVDYYVHLSNEALPAHPYVLVAWLDWQQIPLGAGATPAFFGYIENSQRQTIPAQVTIPADRGEGSGDIHSLQLLYVAYPYQYMTRRVEDAPTPHFFFSQRTALFVGE